MQFFKLVNLLLLLSGFFCVRRFHAEKECEGDKKGKNEAEQYLQEVWVDESLWCFRKRMRHFEPRALEGLRPQSGEFCIVSFPE